METEHLARPKPRKSVGKRDAQDPLNLARIVNWTFDFIPAKPKDQGMLRVWPQEHRRRRSAQIDQFSMSTAVDACFQVSILPVLCSNQENVCEATRLFVNGSSLKMQEFRGPSGVRIVTGEPKRDPNIVDQIDPARVKAVMLQQRLPGKLGKRRENPVAFANFFDRRFENTSSAGLDAECRNPSEQRR